MKTQYKILLAFLIFNFQFFIVTAQNSQIKRTNHWYFGNGTGVDFSSGTAVAVTDGALHTYEGCSVMSDTLGNLLFYTDGDTVWNKNHQPMPNGTGLLGCGNNFGSSAQGALILPSPANDDKYYIFTSDCWENGGVSGYRYSIVNMTLDANKGDVITKNQLLYAPSTEGLTAAKHSNGKDLWLITHEYNTNNWIVYLITPTGINMTPITSSIGIIYSDYNAFFSISPDGMKLATATGGFNPTPINQIFDFDNTNGTITNAINLNNKYYSPAYCAFSPNSTKLYYSLNSSQDIYQYCLDAGNDSASISNTWELINNPSDISMYGQMQISPNGKIYIASLSEKKLSVIDNPNGYSTSSNLIDNALDLNGKESTLSLPNFLHSYLYMEDNGQISCSLTGVNNYLMSNPNFSIYPNPFSTFTNIIVTSEDVRAEAFNITLHDILGKTHNPKLELSANGWILYRDNLPDGVYVLKLNFDNKTYTQKLIINQ